MGAASILLSGACHDDRPSGFASGTSAGQITTAEPSSTTTGSASDGPDPGSSGDGQDGTTAPTTGHEEPGSSSSGVTAGGCAESGCPEGQFCDGAACVPGCVDDGDCAAPTVCDVDEHTCTGCLDDAHCPLGTVCASGTCVAGCTDSQPCAGGLACCGGDCVDALADPQHCGGCEPCQAFDHAAATCSMGQCEPGACEAGWSDCDLDPGNGCETQGTCECDPGTSEACYSGPAGSELKGECKTGTRTCNDQGTGYGPCTGEVTPGPFDVCGNGLDDNCDGATDEDLDLDGDGWTRCGGDCCDEVGVACLNPNLVNPGAFEVMGNAVDDDCDGGKDNALTGCDDGLASDSSDPLHYAQAIDLCQFTSEDAPLAERRWGVISGLFARSDGTGAPAADARSIRGGFGSVIKPQKHARLAVLSSGHAADSNDKKPAFAAFQGGTDLGTDAPVPADWLAANGNNFPNAPGCPEPQGGATGKDTILLKLRVRVPTNALSFSASVYFFSSEYPEWVCSPYNDFFLTLVDGEGNNPADKNVAIYKDPVNQLFPLGVNILRAAPGLFTQCKNGPIGCNMEAVDGDYAGCAGNSELTGTGFDGSNPVPKYNGDLGYCMGNNQIGGGTGWLKMSGNVVPGETMELRFVLWDTSDEWYDSVVLLDNFEWSLQASEPGVQPG